MPLLMDVVEVRRSFKIQFETYLQIDHGDIFRDLGGDFRVESSWIVTYNDSKFPQIGF
jgi:hypothetical protein